MIHTSYTVGITTGEYKALQSVMVDQKEFISNAIKNRARIASDEIVNLYTQYKICLLYTSPSPRDRQKSRMPSSA